MGAIRGAGEVAAACSARATGTRRRTHMANPVAPTPSRRARRRRTIVANGPHPIDVHVGARIRLQRIMRGLTQSDLARRVGISFQSVQKYERGENRVSASRLHEFAQVLGV